MKKLWKILVLLLLIANLFAVFCSGKTVSRTYPLAARVEAMKQAEDTVLFVDGAGNGWVISGIDDWQLGDVAGLLMDDNGTPEYIMDDIVIDVRYGFNPFPNL